MCHVLCTCAVGYINQNSVLLSLSINISEFSFCIFFCISFLRWGRTLTTGIRALIMGPRSAETPPPYSSAPLRPPELDEVRRKRIQIAREQAAEQAAAWRREFEKTIASFRSELLNELRQFRSELTAQVMEPSRPTSAGPVRYLPVTQPVSSELHFGTIDSYKPTPPPATAGLYLQQPPPPPPRPSVTVHALAESPSPAHMRYTNRSVSIGDFNHNMNQQHFSLNDDYGALSLVSVAKVTDIDEKLDMGEGENSDKMVKVNSGVGRDFNEFKSGSAKQDEGGSIEDKEQLSNGMLECHALQLFDKMPKSEGWCNAGRTIIAPMSIRDKGGGLTSHREVVDASDEMTICSVSATQDAGGFIEDKGQVDFTTPLISKSLNTENDEIVNAKVEVVETLCEHSDEKLDIGEKESFDKRTESSKGNLDLDGLWDDSGGLSTMKTKFKSFCKPALVLGDFKLIHVEDHMLGDHEQSAVVTHYSQLCQKAGVKYKSCDGDLVGVVEDSQFYYCKKDKRSFAKGLYDDDDGRLRNYGLVDAVVDFLKSNSKLYFLSAIQDQLPHLFGGSSPCSYRGLREMVAVYMCHVPEFSTSRHKGYFEYDLHITNLIGIMRINAQNLLVHMHEKQIEAKSSALHCSGFINSIINVGIQTIVPSFSHAWDFQIHQLGPPLPTSGHFEVINFAEGLLAFLIYFSISTIGSKMTIIAAIGEICNQLLQPQICNSIFTADSTKLSPFVLVILDIELHNQESLSRPLFGANLLLSSSLGSDDFLSAMFNFFHHWLCLVLVQTFAKLEGLLNHVLEAPGLHEWLVRTIEIGNPYALLLAQKMGEEVDVLFFLVPRLPAAYIPICLSCKVVQCITAVIAVPVILVCAVFLTAVYVRYKLRDCRCTEIDDYFHKIGHPGMVVELINESKQEVPNWLINHAQQSLYYGGGQSQGYICLLNHRMELLCMPHSEIAIFWIWLPTPPLRLKVWVLNRHGLIVIKAQMLIGDAFLKIELMFDNESHIIPTGAIAIRLVCHFGADLQVTNSYSHMDHSEMCWLHTWLICCLLFCDCRKKALPLAGKGKLKEMAALFNWFLCASSEFGTLATLNAWLNGNFLFLRLENKLQKMKLVLADKLKKLDTIVKMMFVDNWESWKYLIIAADVKAIAARVSYGGLSELVASEYFSCLVGPIIAGEMGVYGYKPSVLMDMLAGWLHVALRDKELIKANSTYESVTAARVHFDQFKAFIRGVHILLRI
ncbi:hypothetical protein RchiOBHm_Chr6g0274801 [Rosa chinensis]|uniref:Uncharacterized protein n=1 Tax=Rosa chinensis TaxID=74649 RepID=A0A2P6PRW8_ROSCH|nr:hypothetical protein RchiOBHm_Chr6g0274801 [Rosa chinensis]